MISEETQSLAAQFSEFWSSIYAGYPRYTFDYSWPSVGIVDRLLQHLKHKQMLNEAEDQLLRHATAYLACILHDCWSAFPPDINVEVRTQNSPTFEIEIQATGGVFIPEGTHCSVTLFSLLRRILREPPNPFPVFEQEVRHLNSPNNLISLLMRSLVAGRSQFIKGPWKETPQDQFAPYLHGVMNHLAESSAEYSLRVTPSATHAASPDVYHFNLLLPPLSYEEPFLATRATCGMIDYFRSMEISEEEMLETALLLAANPDEQISSAGFAVAVALGTSEQRDRLIGLSQGFDTTVPLRKAVDFARRLFEKPDDWFDLLQENRLDEAEPILELERDLGMLPLLSLPMRYLSDARLHDFYYFVAVSEAKAASELLKLYCSVHQVAPDILLQMVHLDLLIGDIEHADTFLKQVDPGLLTESTSKFSYLLLKAQLCERHGDFETAAGHLRQAIKEECGSVRSYDTAISSLAAYLMSKEEWSKCLTLTEEMQTKAPQLIAPRLAKVLALMQGQRHDEALLQLTEAYRISPNNLRIFTTLNTCLLERKFK